ncbi:MAG: superoxide dismutase [Candidatus Omnitrophica bacterium]|nr:superoxide dismutase [Candidatus Omnitrophota bacterium]
MLIRLPELPYAKDALEPYISVKTLEFHHGKHHAGYVEKLNDLLKSTPLVGEPLENIIKKTAKDASRSAIFNNAAQVWNHLFYWQCMKKNGGGIPSGEIANKLKADFDGYDKFAEEFKKASLGQFGSGWVWLVVKDGRLAVMKTSNADTPIAHGLKTLLTIDVWEHAYYLDYQNKRGDYIDNYVRNLINWDFVNSLI